MKTYAFYEPSTGRIVQTGTAPDVEAVEKASGLKLLECQSGATGMVVNGQIVPIPKTLLDIQAELRAAVAAERWRRALPLDRAGVRVALADLVASGLPACDFKTAEGFRVMTVAELESLESLMALQTQALFSVERLHVERITQLVSIKEAEQYNPLADWP